MSDSEGDSAMEAAKAEAAELWNTWPGRYLQPKPEVFRRANPCNGCAAVIGKDGHYKPPPDEALIGHLQMHMSGACTVPWPLIERWQVAAAEGLFAPETAVPALFSLRARWCALFPSVVEYRSEITRLLKSNDRDNRLLNRQLQDWNRHLESRGFVTFAKNDLRGINLGGLNLEGPKYSGIQLRHVDMSFSECSVAQIDGANLYGAKLRGVAGRDTRLNYAICSTVDFSFADFSTARLQGSDLSFSDFKGASFRKTNFDGAICYHARFGSGKFSDCSFASLDVVLDDGSKERRFADLTDLEWDENTDFRGALVETRDSPEPAPLIRLLAKQRDTDAEIDPPGATSVHANVDVLMKRMDSALDRGDYAETLHASASVFETMAKDIVRIPTVEDQTLKSFFARYRKDSALPPSILDYILEIYESRNTTPLAGHGSTRTLEITREAAIILAEMTRAFVNIEYRLREKPL